ncbi:MAG: LysR family transcriptional regulator [Nannocystaceae bacterium]
MLRQIWSWLPAFRMVGETEHIRSAARELRVSASALSRSISLLEDNLGIELFTRARKQLRLTEEGRALLLALREAMRLLDEAVLEVEGKALRGALRISAPNTINRLLIVPTLAKLRARHPDLRPRLSKLRDDAIIEHLRMDQLDVAFVTQSLRSEAITQVWVGAYSSGIYVGAGHPLRERRSLTVADLRDLSFVAPPPSEHGRPREGWPPELERNVAVEVTDLQTGIDLCLSGDYIAVFPDLLVADLRRAGLLHRLDLEILPPLNIFALHRRSKRAQVAAAAATAIAEALGLRDDPPDADAGRP